MREVDPERGERSDRAFPCICRHSVSGEMRENPRAEMKHPGVGRRGKMEPVIRTRRREDPFRGEAQTPLPGRHFLTRRRLSYRPPDRDRRPAANARSSPESGLNNSIKLDKFTWFFDKFPNIFGTFYDNIFNRLWISGVVFPGISGQINFKSYVKFKRGISPPAASRSRSAGCRSCPRPPAGEWSRGNSARRATP